MNFKAIFTSLLIVSAGIFTSASAQNNTGWANARQQAHNQLLANHNSSLDKSVVRDYLKEDINRREVHSGFMSAESSRLADNILKEANRHIGKRYVHGAKGPNVFDCSGFTSYVYKQNGITITSWSRGQYLLGKPVDRRDLRKGDLVFFTSRSSGKAVGHVGIVVSADNETGNFKFIHASISGVKISDFAGYYVPRYVGARRLINE